MIIRNKYALVALISALSFGNISFAAVTAEEALHLKSELTPFGAERAGNADGSIPEWNGGFTDPNPDYERGGRRADPFADESPQFSITAENMAEYTDNLTPGTEALLRKYPDTFRIDVYNTHRTAAAPQWVYDNTYENAIRSTMKGNVPENAFGGIPFPIPKSGAEVMWNHQLRWRGGDLIHKDNWYQILDDGRRVLISDAEVNEQVPYYFHDNTLEKFVEDNQPFWKVKIENIGPPIRAGQALLAHEYLDQDNTQTWVYLTGQRRVRRLPNACCDTPQPASAGEMTFDELYVWTGKLDRFDWNIVGKKEMFIPYNTNGFMQPTSDDDVLGTHHWNPDYMRWEKHRVWVVEANLRDGERHQVSKSRYYCDEDTWICVLGDRWDANGQLWKVLWAGTFVAPDLPGISMGAFGMYDLIEGSAFFAHINNEKENQFEYLVKPRSDIMYTPDAMAGSSFR
ncbi:DUF1329 domain-containing protein [Marinobacterium mangrovicola]|uniref:Uncharacterized protein DUF1329 n=1 Tax=Marinobacterium mangrovicola TaxID=1476959 RepID=A0A4R1GFF9_9GAMM|nr:DUF1329 domain-containing protein [Marinobacterium mangrovicola]TCK02942.1 uncharacterized protein DUF1329 [Marinobacterium mangrovicola]